MDNKLSELSKPVAWMHRQLDISKSNSDKADLSVDVRARYSDALYSQEYVSALDKVAQFWIGESAEWKQRAEDAEKRIAELERANKSQDDHINQQQDRIDSLEKTNSDLGRALGSTEKLLEDRLEKWQELASNQCIKINQLQDKLARPVNLPKTNGHWDEKEKAFEDAITLAKREVRLAGFKCVGDE